MKRSFNFILNLFGINLGRIFRAVKGIPMFILNYRILRTQLKSDKEFKIMSLNPQIADKYEPAGNLDKHYFLQDIYFAEKIFNSNPERHIDIGSRIDGFSAHVSVFREIEIIDIRGLEVQHSNIKFIKADLLSIDEGFNSITDSISALHSIEHFGLGRYGDKIDSNGHLKAFEKIYFMLKKGGKFYFSTPIGKQRIEFDAHRVFSLDYLIRIFENRFIINEFSYIDDNGKLNLFPTIDESLIKTINNSSYSCGLFTLTKI